MQQPVVFISSVVRDLKSTRKRVKETLEKSLFYKVVTSETEGSYATSSVRTCKRLARDCDIYIGIFGQKYGTLVPRLGISFTEMEFDEAYKDNPEKILIYVKAGEREPRQEKFLRKVRHASSVYFGRTPFRNDKVLILGIKKDIANFVKERLDIVRKKGLKVVKKVTPSEKDYAFTARYNRATRMIKDALDVARNKGFRLEQGICSEWNPERSYYEEHRRFGLPVKLIKNTFPLCTVTLACPFFVCSRRLKNKIIWFLIFTFPEDFKARYVDYLWHLCLWIGAFKGERFWYIKNILCVFLIHGKVTEPSVRRLGSTCFRTEPGIYVGEPLSSFPSKVEIFRIIPNHMIFTHGIRNNTTMDLKISDILDWLNDLDF